MFTHILAASLTLQSVLTKSFVADPGLAQLFGSSGTATFRWPPRTGSKRPARPAFPCGSTASSATTRP